MSIILSDFGNLIGASGYRSVEMFKARSDLTLEQRTEKAAEHMKLKERSLELADEHRWSAKTIDRCQVLTRFELKRALLMKDPSLTPDQRKKLILEIEIQELDKAIEWTTLLTGSSCEIQTPTYDDLALATTKLEKRRPAKEAFSIAENCYGIASGLNGVATLFMMTGNRKVGLAITKTATGVEAAGKISDGIGKILKGGAAGSMVPGIGTIIGAAASIIALFGSDEQRDVAGERHEQLMDTLEQIHNNILDSLGEHQSVMMECFKKIGENMGYQLTHHQLAIVGGFDALLTEGTRTREVLAAHYRSHMNKMEQLRTEQRAASESQGERLKQIDGMLSKYVADGIKKDFSTMAFMTSLSLDRTPYLELVATLQSMALFASTQDLITGGHVKPGELDLVETALDGYYPARQTNLIRNLLGFKGKPLPHKEVWVTAVNLLTEAVNHRLDDGSRLDRAHHIKTIDKILIQGYALVQFLERLSGVETLESLAKNYQEKMIAFQQAVLADVHAFDQGVVQELRDQTRGRISAEKATVERSLSFVPCPTREHVRYHDDTAHLKAQLRAAVSVQRNRYDAHARFGWGSYHMRDIWGGYKGKVYDQARRYFGASLDRALQFENELCGRPLHAGAQSDINWFCNTMCAIVHLQKQAESTRDYYDEDDEDGVRDEVAFVGRWLANYDAISKRYLSVGPVAADNAPLVATLAIYRSDRVAALGTRETTFSGIQNSNVLGTCNPAPHEQTALITGSGIPLCALKLQAAYPSSASPAVKERWNLALRAEALGAGHIQHSYNSSHPHLVIQTVLKTATSSIPIATSQFVNWRSQIPSWYPHDQALWHFWDNCNGVRYQKNVHPPALPVVAASQDYGYGAHPSVVMSSMVECPSSNTKPQLEALILAKKQIQRDRLKKSIIDRLKTKGSASYAARQELNVAYRLLHSAFLLSLPEECRHDVDMRRFLSGEAFIKDGNTAASSFFNWKTAHPFPIASLQASQMASLEMTGRIISKRRRNVLIPGDATVITSFNSLVKLRERLAKPVPHVTPSPASSDRELAEQLQALTAQVARLTDIIARRSVSRPSDQFGEKKCP